MTRRRSIAMRAVVAITSLSLAGCAASSSPQPATGRMNAVHEMAPCRSDLSNAQGCGNFLSNAAVIGQIHRGQSRAQVRGIMRHDAERREVGSLTESWGYLTNEKSSMMTWITFTDLEVSSVSHEVVARD